MKKNKTNQTIQLKDGRTLGYAEFGDPHGTPIFEIHGNPSSRLGSELFDETAKDIGIHVIGVDRPGMGLSDYKPQRKLLDWPDDVIELADALGFEQFPIVGGSGGVPALFHASMNSMNTLQAAIPGTSAMSVLLVLFSAFAIALDRMWKQLPTNDPAVFPMNDAA